MKSKIASLVATAVLAGVASAPAIAAPVSEFFYRQTGGWLDPATDIYASTFLNFGGTGLTFDPLSGATPAGSPPSTFTTMSWHGLGGSTPTSSIVFSAFKSTDAVGGLGNFDYTGNLDTKWEQGEFWKIATLQQFNSVLSGIKSNNPLWVAAILTTLSIYSDSSLSVASTVYTDPDDPTDVSFWETLNQNNGGTDPGGDPDSKGCNLGSPNPLGSTCDDIYEVALNAFATNYFSYNGSNYALDFGLLPGPTTLVCDSNTATGLCSVASAGTITPGTIKVFTDEGANSDISVLMAWRVVPEPSSLALLGLALLGLGGVSRARKYGV